MYLSMERRAFLGRQQAVDGNKHIRMRLGNGRIIQIRISNIKTNLRFSFKFWEFGFVSDFVLRISNFRLEETRK
jgi:hypothetical protein